MLFFCLVCVWYVCFFFFSSRRRHTRLVSDWSSDVCSSDLSAARPSRAGSRGSRWRRAETGRPGLALPLVALPLAQIVLYQTIHEVDVDRALGGKSQPRPQEARRPPWMLP